MYQLPRLLLLTSIHTRHQTTPPASDMITPNTPPPTPPRPSSYSRNPLGVRRVGAPRDIPGDAFEARVRAFLQGRFWELLRPSLDVTLAPIRAHEHPETPHDVTDPPPPPRSLRSRALEIRDLVRVGELSRAVARADAAALARPSASTIACLSKLHPPPPTQTPCPRVDILPPPLAPPTHPLCNSLIEHIMNHKLPPPRQPTMQDGATSTSCGCFN